MTRQCIHSTVLDNTTYFVVYKNQDRSLRAELHFSFGQYAKSYRPKTKFAQIYDDYKDYFSKHDIQIMEKYDISNFTAALRRLEGKQLKLFSA